MFLKRWAYIMIKRLFKKLFSKQGIDDMVVHNHDFTDMKKESEKNLMIKEQNKLSSERSNHYHHAHIDSIKRFNWDMIENIPQKNPLTSVEKSFLQYMDGLSADNPNIAKYWTYEYNIDYRYLLNMFVSNGYLEISNERELTSMKVDELKEILRENKLKVTGKKSELVDRIYANIPLEKLNITGDYHFVLSDKGLETVKDVKPSATKNTDLEDMCINYIKNENYDAAFEEICRFEVSKKLPRGLGVDWNERLEHGLMEGDRLVYSGIFDADVSKILSDDLISHERLLKSCAILGMMLGTSLSNTTLLAKRVINDKEIDIKDLASAIQKITIGDFENKIQQSINRKQASLLNKIKNKHVDLSKFKSGKNVVDEEFIWVTRHMNKHFTEEAVLFFKHLIDELIDKKLYGEVGLKLETSSGKVFNVWCSTCYIGKISLQKESFMQILTGYEMNDIIVVNDLTLSQYVLLIPEWIKYIKKCREI